MVVTVINRIVKVCTHPSSQYRVTFLISGTLQNHFFTTAGYKTSPKLHKEITTTYV